MLLTSGGYAAFHRPCHRGPGPVGSFLGWLRGVKVSDAGVVVARGDAGTVAVGVRYRGSQTDSFLGQLVTMLLPHGGPEAFAGGPDRAQMPRHLLGCRCLVGALVYLASLRVVDDGFASDFYPEVVLDRDGFPSCAPLDALDVSVGSYVFGEGSLLDRAFSTPCQDYFLRVVQQQLRFAGHHEDRVRTQYCRMLAALLLSCKAARASEQDFAVLQRSWDTIVRGRSFAQPPQWSEDQLSFFRYLEEQLDSDCAWDLAGDVRQRRCFLSGPPGTGKSEVLVHAAKRVVDRGGRVLFLAPTGALVHSYLDRLPDNESIFVDTVHSALRFTRHRDAKLARCNPPSRLRLFDVIFLDEVSMLERYVFEALFRQVQELPQRPVFVVAGDFAQLAAVDRDPVVRRCCHVFHSQFELTTVHRSRDQQHLDFVSAIRESQPSRQLIREYFEKPMNRFLTEDKSLEEWVQFGMRAQEETGHPFVWICNSNKGVATISLAALRNLGISREVIERDGYLADPAVKASLPILPRVGVMIRLTRNLDKARGFVNGALGRIEEVLRDQEGEVVFSLRLMSGTMVLVHPVSYGGQTFLPCVYGYACTVRRTQGLTLYHGALFLDGRVYPRPRGHAYVAVSRFRRAIGVFHYGPLRRSDWLPTDEHEGEQVRPSELSPRDWGEESSDSELERGDFGAHYRESMGAGDEDLSSSEAGDLGAHYRESMAAMGGGFPESEDECMDASGASASGLCAPASSDFAADCPETPFAGFRCAEPEPVWVGSDDEARLADFDEPVKEEVVEEPGASSSCSSGLAAPVSVLGGVEQDFAVVVEDASGDDSVFVTKRLRVS